MSSVSAWLALKKKSSCLRVRFSGKIRSEDLRNAHDDRSDDDDDGADSDDDHCVNKLKLETELLTQSQMAEYHWLIQTKR